jgi:hypothetical protein
VKEMKTTKFFFAALLLSGNVMAAHTPASAKEIPGLGFKDEFVPDGYCLTEIMAVTTQSLAGQQPLLKRPNSGTAVDYYGPCSETSMGQDQPDAQQMDQYGWENKNTIPD